MLNPIDMRLVEMMIEERRRQAAHARCIHAAELGLRERPRPTTSRLQGARLAAGRALAHLAARFRRAVPTRSRRQPC